jgi:hypothetical protein
MCTVRELTEADVEFSLTCEPEDVPLEGNVLASGDDEEDRKAEQWVRDQLDSGNEWAWCTVKVTATWGDFEGVDYLGCCSYRSEAEFKTPDGYWPDMRRAALADLNAQVKAAAQRLSRIEVRHA